ncbi:hypothetical protein tb265_11600 [Gemmatimonadetes bacterium T265]|nr:hypothetical protein tb265_11600 [Gemmatimonadetes bacterium T265]
MCGTDAAGGSGDRVGETEPAREPRRLAATAHLAPRTPGTPAPLVGRDTRRVSRSQRGSYTAGPPPSDTASPDRNSVTRDPRRPVREVRPLPVVSRRTAARRNIGRR